MIVGVELLRWVEKEGGVHGMGGEGGRRRTLILPFVSTGALEQ